MAELLLMEPDVRRAQRMRTALSRAGHHCTLCTTVAQGLSRLEAGCRTMTVLNARMPWTESAPFLRALQSKGLPVLFLTAAAANFDHLRAMYPSNCDVILSDADDETLVRAVERLLANAPATLTLGNLSLNTDTRRVTVDGREETLTGQEFALLQALMEAPDATVSRQELLRTAWGYQSQGMTRTVDVHIQRLRRKLGSEYIETIYKLGYRLNPCCT